MPVGYDGPGSDGGQALRDLAGTYNFDCPTLTMADDRRCRAIPRPGHSAPRRGRNLRLAARLLDLTASENVYRYQYNSSVALVRLAGGEQSVSRMRVTLPLTQTPSTAVDNKQTNGRASGGLIFSLGKDWNVEADFTYDKVKRDAFSSTSTLNAAAVRTDAIAGLVTVLRDPSEFPINGSQYFFAPSSYSPVTTALRIRRCVSGPLFELPGGPLVLSSLLEYRDETLSEQQISLPLSATVTCSIQPEHVAIGEKRVHRAARTAAFPHNGFTGMEELSRRLRTPRRLFTVRLQNLRADQWRRH